MAASTPGTEPRPGSRHPTADFLRTPAGGPDPADDRAAAQHPHRTAPDRRLDRPVGAHRHLVDPRRAVRPRPRRRRAPHRRQHRAHRGGARQRAPGRCPASRRPRLAGAGDAHVRRGDPDEPGRARRGQRPRWGTWKTAFTRGPGRAAAVGGTLLAPACWSWACGPPPACCSARRPAPRARRRARPGVGTGGGEPAPRGAWADRRAGPADRPPGRNRRRLAGPERADRRHPRRAGRHPRSDHAGRCGRPPGGVHGGDAAPRPSPDLR